MEVLDMLEISLQHIYKVYDGDVTAVDDFNLEIENGEFIVFVGPSGCGKSTTLRMIAGLEEITKGDLYIGETRMNDVPPKDRGIAMVFQNYALYPHMTVYDNMAFALKMRKVNKAEIKERVENAAEILGLTDLLNRKPAALSGGQRQRVALGRAIVREAEVFLMDEPLSNLDAKLRVSMRAEITKLHNRLGNTTIYVTHDQTEAMTMADRIVIMKDGIIQQVGTPQEVYNNPKNLFVAGFIGAPMINIIPVTFTGEKIINEDAGVDLLLPAGTAKKLEDAGYKGKEIIFGIRPEDVAREPIELEANADSLISVKVDMTELLGSEIILYSKTKDDTEIILKTNTTESYKIGDSIQIACKMYKSQFFDKDTEESILFSE